MNIAIFSLAHPSYGGGFEQQVKTLAYALSNKRTTVTFITLSKKATYILAILLSILYFHPRFNFPELNRKETYFSSNTKIKIIHFHSFRSLRQILQKYDIIYAKNEIIDSLILFLVKSKDIPPILCGVHTAVQYIQAQGIHSRLHNILYSSFLYSITLRVFNAFHCINTYQVRFLKDKVAGKKIFYIPNFIEIPKQKPYAARKEFTVLYVGRLTQQKGIDLLIDTIMALSENRAFKKIKFIVCGSGDFEQHIRSLGKRFKNLEYKGFVTQKELIAIYRKSDILLMLSRGESFPVTMLEAFCFGVLVIGFNIPGVEDIVKDGKNGFLIEYNNISNVAKHIIKLYNMKTKENKKYSNMRTFARKVIINSYSKERLVLQYKRMFQHVKEQT